MLSINEVAEYLTSKNFYPLFNGEHVIVNFKGLKFAIESDGEVEDRFGLTALQPMEKSVTGFDEEHTAFVPYRRKTIDCYTLEQLVLELGRFFKELDLVISENISLNSLSDRVEAFLHILSKMGYQAYAVEGVNCANLVGFTFKGLKFLVYLDWTDYEYFTLLLPDFNVPGTTLEQNKKTIAKLNRYKMMKNVRAVMKGESLYFVVEAFHSTGLSFAQVLPRYLREIENAIKLYYHEIGWNPKN